MLVKTQDRAISYYKLTVEIIKNIFFDTVCVKCDFTHSIIFENRFYAPCIEKYRSIHVRKMILHSSYNQHFGTCIEIYYIALHTLKKLIRQQIIRLIDKTI